MCGGVASRLTESYFDLSATRWFDILGREPFVEIFRRVSFLKRLVKPDFDERVHTHFVNLNRNANALATFLQNMEKENDLDNI